MCRNTVMYFEYFVYVQSALLIYELLAYKVPIFKATQKQDKHADIYAVVAAENNPAFF